MFVCVCIHSSDLMTEDDFGSVDIVYDDRDPSHAGEEVWTFQNFMLGEPSRFSTDTSVPTDL